MPKKPFNNPFERLKLRPDDPSPSTADRPPGSPLDPGAAPASDPPPSAGAETFSTDSHDRAPVRRGPLTDDELWALAVEGAEPLADRSTRIKPSPDPIAQAAEPLDPELAAYDELRAIVNGAAPFDIADSDEFIEGAARGLDRHVLRRLRRGEFAVQAHVDLHGMKRDEARNELEAFLQRSRQAGKRCVLVVHGRGLHSKDQVPVLKEALKRWMATARFADHVLAFATARPHDGGLGAVYVLLRRL
jgi:DNA-nicking Smr family endonuclease